MRQRRHRTLRLIHVEFHHAQDFADVHRGDRFVPAIIVRHQHQGRVTHLRFAREPRFLHRTHADHARAPASVEIRFDARRELRTLHTKIRSAAVNLRTARAGRGDQILRKIRADRISERHMYDEAVAEESFRALKCAIDKLIWNYQLTGMNFFFQAARRRHRNQMRHAELLHPQNIGARIYFRRQYSMAASVTRKKNNFDVTDASLVKRIRRTAERRFELHQLDLVQPLHLIEAAAADHPEYIL